jgi:hypothetical protein
VTQVEILDELNKLPPTERLAIIEGVLRLLRDELREAEDLPSGAERRPQLAAAAEALLPDYSSDPELTIFTVLDGQMQRGEVWLINLDPTIRRRAQEHPSSDHRQ